MIRVSFYKNAFCGGLIMNKYFVIVIFLFESVHLNAMPFLQNMLLKHEVCHEKKSEEYRYHREMNRLKNYVKQINTANSTRFVNRFNVNQIKQKSIKCNTCKRVGCEQVKGSRCNPYTAQDYYWKGDDTGLRSMIAYQRITRKGNFAKKINYYEGLRQDPKFKILNFIRVSKNFCDAMKAVECIDDPNYKYAASQILMSRNSYVQEMEILKNELQHKSECKTNKQTKVESEKINAVERLEQQQEFKAAPVLETAQLDTDQQILTNDASVFNQGIIETTDPMPYVSNTKPFTVEEYKRLNELMAHIKCEHPDDCIMYMEVVSNAIQQMKQEGFFEKELHGTVDEIMYGMQRYFYHLQPTNPLMNPQEFIINTAKYGAWWAVNLAIGNEAIAIEKVLLAASQIQALSNIDFSKMSQKEQIDFVAQQAADITWAVVTDKAFNKAMPGAKQFVKAQSIFPKGNAEAVVQGAAKFTEAESAVVETPEGIQMEVVPEKVSDTSVLKNAADKMLGTTKGVAKNAARVETVANMKQVFEKNEFGKALKHCTVKTNEQCSKMNSQIYKVIEKMPEYGLKKGDQLCLDTKHFDHIEVYNKRDIGIKAIGIDGTEYKHSAKVIGRELTKK